MWGQPFVWVGFNLFILAMLLVDLWVVNRRTHALTLIEALGWTLFWVALAMLFTLGIYVWRGHQAALEFLTGYLVEESLSVDNLFVFLLIFSYFRVPPKYQHRVLFWGIMGALVFRFTFIMVGITLLRVFHWTLYVFGAFLILTGVKLASEKDQEVRPEKNRILQMCRRYLPMARQPAEGAFVVRESGRLLFTPLFIVLIIVETTDIIFAFDSVPAVLAITKDPFIVYTSNAFAILGLRALYFALAGIMRLFHHLHYGLSAVLVFVGAKMLLADVYEVPITTSLAVIAGLLVLSILASLLWPKPSAPTGLS